MSANVRHFEQDSLGGVATWQCGCKLRPAGLGAEEEPKWEPIELCDDHSEGWPPIAEREICRQNDRKAPRSEDIS